MALAFLKDRDFWWYWLPPLSWFGVVLLMSGDLGSPQNTGFILKWLLSWLPPLSPDQFKVIHFYIRKFIGHFGNYGCLYFLWFRAFRGNLAYRAGPAFLWSMGLCLILSLLDEGHQFMLASRTGGLRDVALDLTGASTVALLTAIFWILRGSPQVRKSPPKPSPGA